MKQYVKSFLLRGLVFAGFGPVIMAVVFWILEHSIEGFRLSGSQVLVATISTYILAFVQAGASVFQQIEGWPIYKSLLWHFLTIYVCYIGAYLVNQWIPFEPMVIVIFTAIFLVSYFLIVAIVSLVIRSVTKKMNEKLQS